MKNLDSIPLPPKQLFEPAPLFLPAPDMTDFIYQTFISDSSELHNPAHKHLSHGRLGVLWTNTEYTKKKRRILGTAEKPARSSSTWKSKRGEYQLTQWFDDIPDFVITLQANFFAGAGNPERCALLEHELMHCAQARDEFGAPRFNQQTGRPVFTIKGHDVEQFIGVIERYGATSDEERRMKKAFDEGPEFGQAMIDGICGTCLKEVA